MLQDCIFYSKMIDLGPNLAQELSGIRFLMRHGEISELSWVGLASPRASTGEIWIWAGRGLACHIIPMPVEEILFLERARLIA